MKLSQVMSAQDWALTRQIAGEYGVDPLLLAAIGWHETHWGRLGAGRYGWHLGYGYYPGSEVKERYRGLERQLRGAAEHYRRHFQGPLTAENLLDYSRRAWRAGDPDAWARSVWRIYTTLQDDLTGNAHQGDTSTSMPAPGGLRLDAIPWPQVAEIGQDKLLLVGALVAAVVILLSD